MQTTINPVEESLPRIRTAYSQVVRRALRVKAVLEELADCEIRLQYISAHDAMVEEGWGWSKHAYPTRSDYARVMEQQGFPDKLGEVDMIQGIKVLRLHPFREGAALHIPTELIPQPLLTLGDETHLARVRSVIMPPFKDDVAGLCEWEMTILKKAIHRRILELINSLRDIESAVKYLISLRASGVQHQVKVSVIGETPGLDALLYRLLGESSLGFQPEPTSFPSYGAAKTNVLRAVPVEVFDLECPDLMVA